MTDKPGNGRIPVIVLVLGLVLAMGLLVVLCGVGFWFTVRQQSRVAAEREVAEAQLVQAQLALENQRQRQAPQQSKASPLAEALAVIRSKQFVDLTHDFEPGIPRWQGFPDEKRETIYWYDEGVAHYPGWRLEVLKYLYEERKITASGHETTDTDPGVATSKADASLEAYILGTDHYQIELLANLDNVPEAGAIVVVTFPKPKGGSGFPARVFAVLP